MHSFIKVLRERETAAAVSHGVIVIHIQIVVGGGAETTRRRGGESEEKHGSCGCFVTSRTGTEV